MLHEAKAAMGAEQAVFVSYIRNEDAHETYRFMLAADPRWCFEYQANAWYATDPWLLYASITRTDPRLGDRVADSAATEAQALAEKYGMVSTCIAPAASSGANARVGMLALGSPQPGFFDTDAFNVFKVLARSLAMELHEWWNHYQRDELIAKLQITTRICGCCAWSSRAAARRRRPANRPDRSCHRLALATVNRKLGSPHRHVMRASRSSTD